MLVPIETTLQIYKGTTHVLTDRLWAVKVRLSQH